MQDKAVRGRDWDHGSASSWSYRISGKRTRERGEPVTQRRAEEKVRSLHLAAGL